MTPDSLFSLAGALALPGWLLLILAPRHWRVSRLLPLLVIPGLLGLLYAALILRHFGVAEGGFGTLADVRRLFGNDWLLLAGWVHYLAFDLVAGAVAAARMDRVAIGRIVQAPILVCIFLFGPLGFVLALLVELALRPVASLRPAAPTERT